MKEQALIIDKDGSLKATDDFEHISADRNSLIVGKDPYLLKISKIREIIYISDGACALKSYRLRRNYLYKTGYKKAPIGTWASLLWAIEELDPVGQFSRISVFETLSRQKISLGEAM